MVFEEVIAHNKQSIYRICLVYAIAPMEPQDLFQEVIYQAWKSWSGFEGRASPGTWLYRIALNVCMAAKYQDSRKEVSKLSLDSVEFKLAAPLPDEQEQAKHRALQACIASLPEAERSLVVLYLEDLPYREIAQVLGISENHVAVKMKRIRAKLFACITQKLAQ